MRTTPVMTECNGLANFVEDSNNLSLILDYAGLIALGLTFFGKIDTFISSLASFITFIRSFITPGSAILFGRLFTYSFFMQLLQALSGFQLLTAFSNLADLIGNILGIISIALSTFSSFPDIFEDIFYIAFDINLKRVFKGYACNPEILSASNIDIVSRQLVYY
jgi:hypothetical protein